MRGLSRIAVWLVVVVAVSLFVGATAALGSQGGRRALLHCPADVEECVGTNRADILFASPDAVGQIVDGRGGNDIINGAGAGALLIGGRGRDVINGGGGDDIDSRDRRVDLVNCLPDDVVVDFDSFDILTGCE